MKQIDDVTIQLIVDGEMSIKRREQLLHGLHHDDPTWKRLACAFMANQSLDKVIGKMVDAEYGADMSGALPLRMGSDGQVETLKNHQPTNSHLAQEKTLPRNKSFLGLRQLSLAICVAIALCAVSFGIGKAWFSETVVVETAVPATDGVASDLSFSEALSRCVTPVPDDFHRDMIKAGFLIDERQRITSVRLPTGEKMEIPIREVQVHELGMSAYQ